MLAQRLRHTIVIQQKSTSLNGYAENAGTWSTFATVRAGIEPVGGREVLESGQNVAEQFVKIVIRYLAGVTPQMRVNWNGAIYNILAVANLAESNRMQELTCTLGTANG